MNRSCIFLVRHGITQWSVENRRLGSSDIPLNDLGRQQSAALTKCLEDVPLRALFSSDLKRSLDTATSIGRPHGLITRIDDRLRERDHGKFEGTVRVSENGADVTSQLSDRDIEENGVEAIAKVWARVSEAYNDIRNESARGSVVVVSHYGPIRMMLAMALGLGVEGRRRVEAECGSVAVISVHEDYDQVICMNVSPEEGRGFKQFA